MASRLGTFVGGLLLGAAVGGLTALLIAPQSGSETRSRLRRALGGSLPDSTDGDVQQRIDALLATARRNLDETIARLNEAVALSQSPQSTPAQANEGGRAETPPPPEPS